MLYCFAQGNRAGLTLYSVSISDIGSRRPSIYNKIDKPYGVLGVSTPYPQSR